MGNYLPLPTKCFEKYLTELGFKYIRTKASHDHWTKKSCHRTITIRSKDKDIPSLHLKTNCRTLGVTLKDLYEWAERNC